MAEDGQGQTLRPVLAENICMDDEPQPNRPIQYVLLNEPTITTNITGSIIESVSSTLYNQGPNSTFVPRGRKTSNQEMIRDENPADCTWLSPKVVMFNKQRASQQPNSDVYLGRQEMFEGRCRQVAIKLIRYTDKHMREIETLLKLDHPNIVQIYDAGEYHGVRHWTYIVMELCSMNVREYVTKNPSDPNKAFLFVKQIIAAVNFMHESNIAHRDIKPTNILISKCGDLTKLSDFGVSKEIPHGVTSVTDTSPGAGSEGYRPPEVYDANYKVILKSDIFSLGLVMAYLFSHGKHPFGNDPLDWSYKIRKNMNFDLSGIPKGIRKRQQLVSTIEKMLHQQPRHRPTINQVQREVAFIGRFENGQHNDGRDYANDIMDNVDTSSEDIKSERQFTHKKLTIALFDEDSHHLYLFDHRNKSMTKMQPYPQHFRPTTCHAVSLGEYIYIFDHHRSLYRLKYCRFDAIWERMADWVGDHGGLNTPVVASSTAIFLVGGGRIHCPMHNKRTPTNSVSKYIQSSDHWEKLKDKPTATEGSALVFDSNFLYCIGGRNDSNTPTNIVERLDLSTMEWSRVASMKHSRFPLYAAECTRYIYVVGHGATRGRMHMEMYDPYVNQWTETKSFNISDDMTCLRRLFGIDYTLFAVARKSIQTYDIRENEWQTVKLGDNIAVKEAVLIKM